jgi:hypothetical protein
LVQEVRPDEVWFYGRCGGKLVPVDDIEGSAAEALKKFQRCWPWHSQGQHAPPADGQERITIADMANEFLASKLNRRDAGELSTHSFDDLHFGLEQPSFFASRIIAAPIRHLTSSAKLRPSILARAVDFQPRVMRFKRTRGSMADDRESRA